LLNIFVDSGKALEKRLNHISYWHSKLYKCNNEFERIIKTFTEEDYTEENQDYISRLEEIKTVFQTQVDDLYISLGIQKEYPALKDVDAKFVKSLLMCRDAKIELRRVATCYLSASESINDAAGGANDPIGAYLYLFML
jgi:hypothetical protein